MAKKCFDEIAKLTAGELSPESVKRIVYTYVPIAKRKKKSYTSEKS